MRKILDRMFEQRILAIGCPIIFSVVMYALFLLLGADEGQNELMIVVPIATVAWFFGSFLIFLILIKNPRCPDGFVDVFELLSLIFFVGYSIVSAVIFIASGFTRFDLAICLGSVTYSSISLAHSKRK